MIAPEKNCSTTSPESLYVSRSTELKESPTLLSEQRYVKVVAIRAKFPTGFKQTCTFPSGHGAQWPEIKNGQAKITSPRRESPLTITENLDCS